MIGFSIKKQTNISSFCHQIASIARKYDYFNFKNIILDKKRKNKVDIFILLFFFLPKLVKNVFISLVKDDRIFLKIVEI